ncbi:MAG TPA: SPOR domain-containing protein, partial [Rhodothermales bacterium]
LLRGPEAPAVAVEQTPEPAATEVLPDTAAIAGGLADSLAAPQTGAASETVAEAEESVETEPEPEPTPPAEPSPIDVSSGGWTVVVASAATPGEARQIADRFRSLGYTPAVLYGSYGGVTRYRVVVRQFATEAEAQAFLRSAPQGLPGDAWRLPVTSDFEVIPRQ